MYIITFLYGENGEIVINTCEHYKNAIVKFDYFLSSEQWRIPSEDDILKNDTW